MRRRALLPLLLAFAASAHAAPRPGPVVLLGASVVQFWTDEHPAFFTEHPNYLDHGRAGEPPASTVSRMSQEVLPLKPRVLVFITGGAATPERTVHDLVRLTELGRKSGARLVLAASPAVRPGNLAAIHDYAAAQGLGYADFADMRGADGRVKPGLTYDGVHPTPAGYALMEPVMVAAVDKALAAP